jgi:hypothetical protein
VLRLRRDLREGATSLGLIGTSTLRNSEDAELLGLRDRALIGGFDFSHRFRNRTAEFRGHLVGSHVQGSAGAITATQRAPGRYFQRPDADHLELDPTRTSLDGWTGEMVLAKNAGGPWRFASITQARSPGFEVNDLGFTSEVDYVTQFLFLRYTTLVPNPILRSWELNANIWNSWTFGGEDLGLSWNFNGSAVTQSTASSFLSFTGSLPGMSTTLLRGGPAMRTEADIGWSLSFNSDRRRDWQAGWGGNVRVRPESGSLSWSISPNVRWTPSPRVFLQAGPFLRRRLEDRQWVTRLQVDGTPAYLFAALDQTTAGATMRAELTVTSNLSLQIYAEPFHSTGTYDDFKRVSDPLALNYSERFLSLDVARQVGGGYAFGAEDGRQVVFGNPDFSVGQFRANSVLRWEYRPGSTLFLVWSQARDEFGQDSSFGVIDGFDSLFRSAPTNVLMIKASYWINP